MCVSAIRTKLLELTRFDLNMLSQKRYNIVKSHNVSFQKEILLQFLKQVLKLDFYMPKLNNIKSITFW